MTPNKKREVLAQLLEKGVRIPCPESVEIGPDISADRISGDRVVIHTGCKIYGPKTLIMPGVQLGYEAPVTLHNCQLGRDVELKGGFFDESTFLDKASMGFGAQIREGCLIEEEAHGAHTVGLKHTILFPFVTLGSLINFCDCLMAGGTDRKNHSEVGSSYIHFNFNPNQDKATASLIGDVPRGVMLNQPPIFLGGQGGLVGPVKVEYGTVVVAGTIVRKDIRRKNTMVFSQPSISKGMPFHAGLYSNVRRIITLNTLYVANLIALRRWYLDIRSTLVGKNPEEQALQEGALERLDMAIGERLKRLGEVAARMPYSIEVYKEITGGKVSEKTIQRKREFFERWEELEQVFRESLEMQGSASERDEFLQVFDNATHRCGKDYVSAIKGLEEGDADIGVSWLQGLVDEVNGKVWGLLRSFGVK